MKMYDNQILLYNALQLVQLIYEVDQVIQQVEFEPKINEKI